MVGSSAFCSVFGDAGMTFSVGFPTISTRSRIAAVASSSGPHRAVASSSVSRRCCRNSVASGVVVAKKRRPKLTWHVPMNDVLVYYGVSPLRSLGNQDGRRYEYRDCEPAGRWRRRCERLRQWCSRDSQSSAANECISIAFS